MKNTHAIGAAHEQQAAEYLESKGYRILERNYRNKCGEIDLIAKDPAGCIVFVEVKYRASDTYGDPSVAVNLKKQQRISRTGMLYLMQHGSTQVPARFDVISICGTELKHLENAFPYRG